MPEVDKTKPQAPEPGALKPKQEPDDGALHTLTVFAQSLAYSGLEGPARGVAQIVDRTFSTNYDRDVQKNFDNAGIHKPDDADFGTHAWTAQQFGAAIGTVLPMKLARLSTFGLAEKELFSAAKVEGGIVASTQRATIIDKAIREATISAKTGFVYGAVFTPTEDNDKSTSNNFFANRFTQGLKSGTVFGATGYASGLSGAVFDRAAAGLETTILPGAFKTTLQTALHSDLIRGAIGGVPGGVVQAQIGAMQDGRLLATTQEIKENVASMSMVGGAMGSAGIFKDTPSKIRSKNEFSFDLAKVPKAIVDNLTAFKNDSIQHSVPAFSPAIAEHPQFFPSPTKPKGDTKQILEYTKPAEPAHPFDIKFDPGSNAWSQAQVDQYKTHETRSIDFAKPGREAKAATEDWKLFHKWGVESRNVPVDVYKFPGLKTEIVVPSDYARVLDQLRAHRNNPGGGSPLPEGSPLAGRLQRVLPEEMAQMIMQTPQPDIAKRVDLLDHANPHDMLFTKNKIDELTAKGQNPPTDYQTLSFANATIDGRGRMSIFESQTNNPISLQFATSHEWSHLAQTTPAFASFEAARTADGQKFYARSYAEENIHEDWAVHLGERILGPKGKAFEEIPENAPARTLVMTKALRDMLEQRKDNPTPKHAEFMARVLEAENIATMNFQLGIQADIISGNHEELDKKLKFVNAAVVASNSPEIHENLLGPVHNDLVQALATRGSGDQTANSFYASKLASYLATSDDISAINHFTLRWKFSDDIPLQAHLFKNLPDARQVELLTNLSTSPFGYDRDVLYALKNATHGDMQQLVQDTLNQAQLKFEKEGIRLDRTNQTVPKAYGKWLGWSLDPEARIVSFKQQGALFTAEQFKISSSQLPPASVRRLITDGALAYVQPNFRPAAWANVLADLPQAEQAKLFRDLGHQQKGAFSDLAVKTERMDATQFAQHADEIRDKSFALLKQRLSTPEFIVAHPQAIKDGAGFLEATKSLDNKQIADFIRDGALDCVATSDRTLVIKNMTNRLGLREQVDLLGAIKPSFNSKERIDLLSRLSENQDPVVGAKAQRILVNIAEAQLAELKSKLERGAEVNPLDSQQRDRNHDDFLSYHKLTRKMLEFDDARARLAYLKATAPDANGHLAADKFSLATFGLSDEQLLKFLKSGIVDRLPQLERKPFLRNVSARRSEAVRTQALFIELATLSRKIGNI